MDFIDKGRQGNSVSLIRRYRSGMNCFKIAFLLVLALPAIPAPGPGTIWPEGVYTTTIPLKRAGRLFLLEATIDGVTGNFILDTGSSKLVLNSTYFRNTWKVKGTEAGGVTGSAGAVQCTSVKKFQVAGLTYLNLAADAADLGHIENRRGVKVLGLFGCCMMRNMEAVIDAARNQLRLFRLDRSGKRIGSASGAFQADVKTKLTIVQDVAFVTAVIGTRQLNFCLDTGAESNMLSTAAPKKVMSTVTILRRSDLCGVSDRRGCDMLIGALNDFSIGGRKITGMQAMLAGMDQMSSFYEFPVDGMLGFDFFEQDEISINLVTQELGILFRKGGKP